MRLTLRCAGVVSLIAAVKLCAQTTYFEVSDGLWETPSNWSTRVVPGDTSSVSVTFSGRTVHITQPGALCANLVVGYSFGETGTVHLATGTLYSVTSQNIGRNGRGTFIQEAETTNRFSSFVTLGEAATANGWYRLQGGFLGGNGTAGDMNVGYSGTGVFYQTGGVLGDFGTSSSSRYLFLGRAASGLGTYVIDGGEILLTNQSYVSIGHAGSGSFIQSNGTVRVSTVFNVGKEAGGRGEYRLVNGTIRSGQFTIGEKATAQGTARIEGGAFGTTAEGLDVGYFGTGTVAQSGGEVTLNKYLFIGRSAGSKGTYVLTGGDLALTNVNNHMYVGEYGNGTLLQSNGSIRVKNWCTVSRRTGSSGLYRMNGGALTVDLNLQLGEEANSRARFEIIGTNAAVACKTMVITTNAVLRFEIATNGVSKINVQNQATLAGKLEVAVQQKLFNQPVTVIDAGSLSGQFDAVTPILPLKAVDIAYQTDSGNVVLSNFRYHTGTLMTLF